MLTETIIVMQVIAKKFTQYLKLMLDNFMHYKAQVPLPLASTQTVSDRNVNGAIILKI
jgi:hypothetical protein